ncbi:ADAMTS-like protein 4 [Armadillidium nasatum]|uniref:ADAMTS-like protein 4 n=1 Tax=Armadillidium nasatum TaxID=96803 RepID=A0A5N5SLV7_9CRUS|nr:ADAMTS-like protein 4 [Armadillidium nasatum]
MKKESLLFYSIFILMLFPCFGEECFSCKSTGCRRIRGIFNRPSLPVGYNLIARIPAFTCNLTITEVNPSNNFLALRTANGYIINGNWNVVPSGRYMGAGTSFIYTHTHSYHGQSENIFSPGPLMVYVDVMVIYQSSSLFIKYEYWQPLSQLDVGTNPVSFLPQSPPQTVIRPMTGRNIGHFGVPSRRRPTFQRGRHGYLENVQTSFVQSPNSLTGYIYCVGISMSSNDISWKVWKFTPCSKSCGGGQQETVHICTGPDGQILDDINCGETRPPPQTVSCNTKPCPPKWMFGEWSQCSATCGTGQMMRSLTCVQETGNGMTRIVPASMCPPKPMGPMVTTQLCNLAPCTRWHVNAWGKCSVECGTGIRMRDVTCQADGVSITSNQCNEQEKPFHQELCHAHICAKHTWFFTEWSKECIGGCENGVHIRRVWCSPGINSLDHNCSLAERPPSTKPCTNPQACGAAWFTGPWSPCSSLCGNGTKSREVVCVVYLRGSFRATFENECDPAKRPKETGVCNTQDCPPHWYFTDWTECSRKCGRGSQRRAVQCLDSIQHPSLECSIGERPQTTRPCNTQPCNEPRFGNCVDRFQNCLMVLRARLCKYSYYKTICCATCNSNQ